MQVKLSEIVDAVAIPLISMAKIEGQQSAGVTLKSLWDTILPIAPSPSIDVRALTTAGLYENNPKYQPYLQRQKTLRKLNKFSNEWHRVIKNRANQDEIIIPRAYEINSWDMLVHDSKFISLFVKNYGELRHAYQTNEVFKKSIEQQADERNILLDEAQLAFWLEEYANIWGLISGQTYFSLNQNSLRKTEHGSKLMFYPEKMDEPLIMACQILAKCNKISLGEEKLYWVDIKRQKPQFVDIAVALKNI